MHHTRFATRRHAALPAATRAGALLIALLTLLTACGTGTDEPSGTLSIARADDITISSLLDGETVTGTITIAFDTHKNVDEVHFHHNGDPTPLTIDTSAPFELQLDTSGLADGPHTITAHTPVGNSGSTREIASADFTVANSTTTDTGTTDGSSEEDTTTDEPTTEPTDEPTEVDGTDDTTVDDSTDGASPVDDTGVVYGGPITITRGGTYSGAWESLDPDVPAVLVATDEPVIIENASIRSASHMISAPWTNADLTIREVRGYAVAPTVAGRTAGRFLHVEGYERIHVERSYLQGTSGIYLNRSAPGATVRITRNRALDIDGRRSDGNGGYDGARYRQFVQLNAGDGLTNSEISWNEVINRPHHSRVEDVINTYKTTGTPDDPVRIHNNYIQGAYPDDPASDTFSGGGILLGDENGAYLHAYDNHIVSTTNYGIAIAGGHHNSIHDNRVVSCGQLPDGTPIAAQNVGIYIWNAYDTPTFNDNTGQDNQVAWQNDARRNDWWVPDADTWTRNTPLHDPDQPVPCTAEQDEHEHWQRKLTNAGITIGPRSTTDTLALRAAVLPN